MYLLEVNYVAGSMLETGTINLDPKIQRTINPINYGWFMLMYGRNNNKKNLDYKPIFSIKKESKEEFQNNIP